MLQITIIWASKTFSISSKQALSGFQFSHFLSPRFATSHNDIISLFALFLQNNRLLHPIFLCNWKGRHSSFSSKNCCCIVCPFSKLCNIRCPICLTTKFAHSIHLRKTKLGLVFFLAFFILYIIFKKHIDIDTF